jgi:hypothetical protein
MRMAGFLESAQPAAPAAEGYGAILKARVKRDDDGASGDQEIFHLSIPFNDVSNRAAGGKPEVCVARSWLTPYRKLPARMGDRLGNYPGPNR